MVEREHPITYEESMNTVLKQELIRYNRLIDVMHRSLKSVGLAMRGLIVLSSELEEMAVQMYNNMQPALWKSKSYPSLKPLASYVHDFVLRMAFYQGRPHGRMGSIGAWTCWGMDHPNCNPNSSRQCQSKMSTKSTRLSTVL